MTGLGQNMGFEVALTSQAQLDFRDITDYLLYELKNVQAVDSVMGDMEDTIERLSRIAGSLKLCEDPQLRDLGYRTIHFKHHKYFMLYRVEGVHVYVDGIYHDLQDYEIKLK